MSSPVEWRRSSSLMSPGTLFMRTRIAAKSRSNASSLPALIVAMTMTRVRIGTSLEMEDDFVDGHTGRLSQRPQRCGEFVLCRAALESREGIAVDPVGHDHEAGGVARIAHQRLPHRAWIVADLLGHGGERTDELVLRARPHLHVKGRSDHLTPFGAGSPRAARRRSARPRPSTRAAAWSGLCDPPTAPTPATPRGSRTG